MDNNPNTARNKCRNCRRWIRALGARYGYCKGPHLQYLTLPDEMRNDSMGYFDDMTARAGIPTGEDFGCVNFVEAKNAIRM